MLTPYVADNEAANTSGDTVHYDTPQRGMIHGMRHRRYRAAVARPDNRECGAPYMQGSFSSSFDEITWGLG